MTDTTSIYGFGLMHRFESAKYELSLALVRVPRAEGDVQGWVDGVNQAEIALSEAKAALCDFIDRSTVGTKP